jgi:hypothetical protein
MTNFLFWNTKRSDLSALVVTACREHEIDVLILAECGFATVSLVEALNERNDGGTYLAPFDLPTRLKFISRYPPGSVSMVHDDGGIAARRLRPPKGVELLVVGAHLPSKLWRTRHEQAHYARDVVQKIRDLEVKMGHTNTVVIGDLNMDPFEEGMLAADGFHAVMDQSIAMKISRTVDGKERDFFYNPMWGRFGDETHGPCGTFYRRGGSISSFWHMFDQVLLRPSLLQYYSPSALRILDEIGGRCLLKDGRIDTSISDHLPIFLHLDVERGA